ncbi:hypothetical protein CTAYLR_010224 [Chrysophaeum taylorii]|uniref:N-acetyltransferase domain-containing protein n=1 Tax=Chrysophaeum taylorii TaxID=2483200 RepID=A0AAD7U7M5_9STRA|nr:hypothetical protein CTAYLR_010224 [Chrysophaeum taylorii]
MSEIEEPSRRRRCRKKPQRFHEVVDQEPRPSSKPERRKNSIVVVEKIEDEGAISRVLGGLASPRSAALLDAVTALTLEALPLDQEHIDYLLDEAGTATFVAHSADDLVLGGACVRRAHSSLFQLSFLAVDPENRGKRLGARLLKRVLHHARHYRVTRVAAYADHTALDFFEKHGFHAATLPDYLFSSLDQYTLSTLVVANVDAALKLIA